MSKGSPKPKKEGRNPDGTFAKGFVTNPAGKPKGARHKATLAAEALLDGEAETLTRRAIEKAKDGDTVALRLCLERILPPRKDRPVQIALPQLTSATDATAALAMVAEKVGAGEVTPEEGAAVNAIVGGFIRAHEITVLERRLEIIEKRLSDDGK
jgi:Family of unknown function (DUF5681)